MVDAVLLDGVLERGDGSLLPDDFVERLASELACQDGVGHEVAIRCSAAPVLRAPAVGFQGKNRTAGRADRSEPRRPSSPVRRSTAHGHTQVGCLVSHLTR